MSQERPIVTIGSELISARIRETGLISADELEFVGYVVHLSAGDDGKTTERQINLYIPLNTLAIEEAVNSIIQDGRPAQKNAAGQPSLSTTRLNFKCQENGELVPSLAFGLPGSTFSLDQVVITSTNGRVIRGNTGEKTKGEILFEALQQLSGQDTLVLFLVPLPERPDNIKSFNLVIGPAGKISDEAAYDAVRVRSTVTV